jgi:hypothetical protein
MDSKEEGNPSWCCKITAVILGFSVSLELKLVRRVGIRINKILVRVWTGHEVSRRLRLQDFKTIAT